MYPMPPPNQPAGIAGPLDVELPSDAPVPQVMPSGAIVTEDADGSVLVDLEPSTGAPGLAEMGWDDNLAEALPESLLTSIAEELLEGVEADDASREEWLEQYARGVKLLGITPEQRDTPFDGACGVYHPMLLEAVLRGQSNARAEMLPAAGPVRVEIADDADPITEAQAQRKQTWLNYYLTTVYEGYYPDFDQMLLLLYIGGSMFKKVYRDPIKARPVAPAVEPKDLIVNYAATSLEDAQRITHAFPLSKANLIRSTLKGYYRDIDLALPDDDDETNAVTEVRDETDGRTAIIAEGDEQHMIYEVHCELDIEFPGLQHEVPDQAGADPFTGQPMMIPTGLPLPYIVTIDRDSRRVLRLARNWKDGDPDFKAREWFIHYQLMPGLGFYGWGYAHVLGGSAEAATMQRRQGIDSATLASFPGGFRVKGMRMDNVASVGPCEFIEIDTGGLPIGNAVMPMPYREVGPAFMALMQDVVASGQRIGNTMDMQVGDGRQDAPVGTTVALIEKAQRPETAQLKRLHTAHRKELRLLAALFGEEEPTVTYPFRSSGKRGEAMATDFKDTEDIQPVSDPNNPTQTQRLAVAQARLQMAQQFPQMLNLKAAVEGVMVAMGDGPAEIARLTQQPPPPPPAQPLDPISEFQMAMAGKPIAVGPWQVHQAHIISHQGQVQIAQQQNPQAAMALVAHIGEHVAALYRQQIEAQTGQPLPPPGQPLPPQVEAQIAVMVAQVTGPLMQQIMATMAPPPKGASDPQAAALEREGNQLKLAELQQRQSESDRKAEADARQDAVQLETLRTTVADNAAERQQRNQDNQIDLIQEVMRMQQAQQSDETQRLGHVVDAFDKLSGIAAAQVTHQPPESRP